MAEASVIVVDIMAVATGTGIVDMELRATGVVTAGLFREDRSDADEITELVLGIAMIGW